MKRVAQYNMRVDFGKLKRRHGFNRSVSANWHKSGRLHIAVRQMHGAATSEAIWRYQRDAQQNQG